MRLIDADILMDYVERQRRQIPAKEYDNDGFYHYSGWNGACVMARCAIKGTPTVDAVMVVRCRDCINYNTMGCSNGFGWCEAWQQGRANESFCDCGERR